MSTELQLQDILVFVSAPLASTLSLATLHWFPWYGGTRQLNRIAAYAVGTAITVGVPVAAMLLTAALGMSYGHLFWAALLIVNALASGATVGAAYWVDSTKPVSTEDVSNATANE